LSARLAVVTGAPGWLGTTLVETLVRGASFRAITTEPVVVRCIVEPGADASPLAKLGERVEIVRADIREARALDGALRGARHVFHGAAVIHPRRVADFDAINVAGTRNVLAAAIAGGVERFVLVSSSSPAGPNEMPSRLMTEDDAPRPYMGYGRSKLVAERLVQQAHREGRLDSAIVRPCWFYGPQQPARQTRFFSMIQRGTPVVFGRGDSLRSMSYVDNAVQGLLLAANSDRAAGKTYWIADRRPYPFIEIIHTVARLLGVDVRPRYLPLLGSDLARAADRLLQVGGWYNSYLHVAGELSHSFAVSIDAAARDLGYDPEIDLEEGMRRSIAWCRAQGMLR
jgi:nucleoside-diphosphate-sugar epimerase